MPLVFIGIAAGLIGLFARAHLGNALMVERDAFRGASVQAMRAALEQYAGIASHYPIKPESVVLGGGCIDATVGVVTAGMPCATPLLGILHDPKGSRFEPQYKSTADGRGYAIVFRYEGSNGIAACATPEGLEVNPPTCAPIARR